MADDDRDTLLKRLHELQRERDEGQIEYEEARLLEDFARQTRMAAHRQEGAAQETRLTKARDVRQVEEDIAEVRKKLRADSDGEAADVTDRAVVRWLQLVDGFDIDAVRVRILDELSQLPFEQEGKYRVYRLKGCRVYLNEDGMKVFTVQKP